MGNNHLYFLNSNNTLCIVIRIVNNCSLIFLKLKRLKYEANIIQPPFVEGVLNPKQD